MRHRMSKACEGSRHHPLVRWLSLVPRKPATSSIPTRRKNVGPVVKGDVLLCKLKGLPDMSIKII